MSIEARVFCGSDGKVWSMFSHDHTDYDLIEIHTEQMKERAEESLSLLNVEDEIIVKDVTLPFTGWDDAVREVINQVCFIDLDEMS